MVVKLRNVRLAFPSLYTPTAMEKGQKLKYGATFLIPKNDPQIKAVVTAMRQVAMDLWKDKAEAVLTELKYNPKNICLRDGEMKASKYDGFAGCMSLHAKNEVRPALFDRDRTPLNEDSGRLYSGCYVNANVDIYAFHHPTGGNMVLASLQGVQFAKDGDAFAGSPPSSADDFDDVADIGDSDDSALI